ncbi:Xaa-Pro dipeptidase [Pueribacillus theae]|uniref:Xaa-Pro dipeptidase n=1 Tax=Pueribacillus theae TaxID=2171751 RepID=A0A2U1K836_9BACI|nr:Xaa-Pro peptidase family protein [Pueribacillus theae]PWA13223.1 Xaa-Pro dipeptidase [Pueribacillus theae]
MLRVQKLREVMKKCNIDSMLITSSSNLRYMTNFTGTAGIALISLNEAKFITDFRYTEQAKEQAKGYDIVEHKGKIIEEIAKQAEKMKINQLGFEEDHVTYSTYQTYKKEIPAQLIPVSGIIEELRLIKDNTEIQIVKEAAEIADAAFEHIITYIKPGMREREISDELEFFMRKKGATSSSFDTIVASGYRSALPHGVASDKVIEEGDFVTLDYGAYYKGYCSDTTRTIAVGEPSDQLKEIYAIVLEAQRLGVEGIKPGMSGKEADALTRNYIKDKGYGDYFGHSTGHGIGLDIHEGPTLSVNSETILKPGMIVTVEPGIYLSGIGGVRIEDDILITETGNKRLTKATKELIIL